MNIWWNKAAVVDKTEGDDAALLRVLKVTAIVTVASSCSMLDARSDPATGYADTPQASSEDYPPAPAIERVTEEKSARFADFLASEGYQDVQFVSIAYSENGEEKLIALQFRETEEIDPPVDENEFLIPPVGKNFGEAVVLYTGSPARATSCGRSSGGTRYCNF